VSASQQFQAKGFYLSGCVSLVLAALKLTEMKQWSWWRVFLPLWVIVGHNVIYVLVGFLCLFAVRYGEGEEADEPAKVQSDRIVYQVASLVCVLRHSRKPVESSIRFEDKIPQWLHEIFGRDNQSRAVKPGDHSDTLDFDFCHRR